MCELVQVGVGFLLLVDVHSLDLEVKIIFELLPLLLFRDGVVCEATEIAFGLASDLLDHVGEFAQ